MMTEIICHQVNQSVSIRIRRWALPFLFAVMLAPWGISSAVANEKSARTLVESFHATLQDVMKNAEKLGMKGRIQRLGPPITRNFHLRLMVAIASGQHWRKASESQRQGLHEAFERFSIVTYADRFSSYSGESFETVSVKEGPRGTILVNTRINRRNKSPVAITYVLKGFEGVMRIVDIVVDAGISELAVHRSEYAQTLKRSGVDALISALYKKSAALLNKP